MCISTERWTLRINQYYNYVSSSCTKKFLYLGIFKWWQKKTMDFLKDFSNAICQTVFKETKERKKRNF